MVITCCWNITGLSIKLLRAFITLATLLTTTLIISNFFDSVLAKTIPVTFQVQLWTQFLRSRCLLERFFTSYTNSVHYCQSVGNDPLMREVYEVDAPSPPRTLVDIHPGHATFWRYRTRITVELVIRNFQDVDSNKTSRKILGRFFDEVTWLTAIENTVL